MLLTVLALGVASGLFGAGTWVILGGSVWVALLVYGLAGSLGVALSAALLLARQTREPALADTSPASHLARRRKDRASAPSLRRRMDTARVRPGSPEGRREIVPRNARLQTGQANGSPPAGSRLTRS